VVAQSSVFEQLYSSRESTVDGKSDCRNAANMAAAMLDHMQPYADSAMDIEDQDQDQAFPCKGCGEVRVPWIIAPAHD